jgi:hypothetical protein
VREREKVRERKKEAERGRGRERERQWTFERKRGIYECTCVERNIKCPERFREKRERGSTGQGQQIGM